MSRADAATTLADLYPALRVWLTGGEQVLVHQEELGDLVQGVMAGYLVYAALVPSPAEAISIVERITQRQPLEAQAGDLATFAAPHPRRDGSAVFHSVRSAVQGGPITPLIRRTSQERLYVGQSHGPANSLTEFPADRLPPCKRVMVPLALLGRPCQHADDDRRGDSRRPG